MSEFDQAVQQERMRLMGLISETKDKIAELQSQVATDELRIKALDAYDRAQVAKASGDKKSKKVSRLPKPTIPVNRPED